MTDVRELRQTQLERSLQSSSKTFNAFNSLPKFTSKVYVEWAGLTACSIFRNLNGKRFPKH